MTILEYTNEEKRQLSHTFNQLGVSDYEYTTDPMAPHDAVANIKNIKIICEVKVRDITVDKYPTALLELQKSRSLFKKSRELFIPDVWYYCFYPLSNYLVVFNLTKINLNKCECKPILCPKNEITDPSLVWKDCILIPMEYGKKFKIQ